MLKNYLTVALRALRQQRLYAAINVLGLAVGLACAILIYLYVQDELTYDRFHTRQDRIHRLARVSYNQEEQPAAYDVYLPLPMAQALKNDIPEVESTVRLRSFDGYLNYQEQLLEEEGLLADPDFFNIFTFPLVQGNPETALQGLNRIVLTESMAMQLFGNDVAVALGQQVSVRITDAYMPFEVVGIAEDPPSNATIQFRYILPFEQIFTVFPSFEEDRDDWHSSAWITYALLREGATTAEFQDKLLDFRKRYYADELEDARTSRGWEAAHWPTSYLAQPLSDIHLNSEIRGGISESSNPQYSYTLGYLGLAILLIAAINFMTLAIGRSAKRGREVAMRKVIGAQRWQVISQFWLESIFLATLALALAIALVALLLPAFNSLADKGISLSALLAPQSVAILLGLVLVTGLISGSYPALVLARFRPLEVFRNALKLGGVNLFTRSLVVLQFSISSALLLGTAIVWLQIDYLRSKDLGYTDDQVVVVPNRSFGDQTVLTHFQNQLSREADVLQIAGVLTSFGRGYATSGWDYEQEQYRSKIFPATPNYLETLELELVEGRPFNPELATDSGKVIVNETFLTQFNWDRGVGQHVPGFQRPRLDEPEVIGVVRDYQFQSLEQAVEPLMIYLGAPQDFRQVLVKVSPHQLRETVGKLEGAWNEVAGGELPFEYSFLDEDMDRLYGEDERWGKITQWATGLTLFVACLGLFGLAALTVQGRQRQLGIRKILGANGWQLAWVILRGLALLIGSGLVLGIPIAAWFMQGWLENYAYRVTVPAWLYALPVVLMATLGILTLAWHLVRAQRINPVESLRTEG